MVKNAVFTWASGEAFCNSEGFTCYLNSLDVINEADIFVFSHDMPDDARLKIERKATIIDIKPNEVEFLLRDRHRHYRDFLLKNKNAYRKTLITDSKDVVFQRDPFENANVHWYEFIYLVGEGMNHVQSGWNLIDQYEAQRNAPQLDYRDWPVINGGVMLGTSGMLRNLLLMWWSMMTRSAGKCTDQGFLNYLYNGYLQDETCYFVKEPQRHLFCVTGEAIKEGLVDIEFRDGQFIQPLSQQPYYIVHQWDRVESEIVRKIKEKYLF